MKIFQFISSVLSLTVLTVALAPIAGAAPAPARLRPAVSSPSPILSPLLMSQAGL
ncbi:MAG: hypothetical protein HC781_02810 [Leptolyngbyaceae cyanobacterium CSU_1_4]|nr:hypothetical protein [Leptolyngbyaceae cyanobacterium CSU_1_4]